MSGALDVKTSWKTVGGCKVCLLQISGNIDAAVTKELDAAFNSAIGDGAQHFVLDFAGVEYISSAGLRLLLKLRRAAIEAGGRVKVAGMHREIRENVFDSLGFSKLIDVYGTSDEALASIEGKKKA